MYIELMAEVDGFRVELVGSHYDNDHGDYLAVVRYHEGHELRLFHPSRVTIVEKPILADVFGNDLVTLLLRYGAKLQSSKACGCQSGCSCESGFDNGGE